MKKIILLFSLLIGVTMGSRGQGTIWVGNLNNTDQVNTAATTQGSFWTDSDGISGVGPPVLLTYNYDTSVGVEGFNITLLGGSSTASLQMIATVFAENIGDGQYLDFSGTEYTVPGVPSGGTGWFEVLAWMGTDPDFATALVDPVQVAVSGLFQTPVDNGAGAPLLAGMPAMLFETIPEPGTMGVGCLGLVSFLVVRRRK